MVVIRRRSPQGGRRREQNSAYGSLRRFIQISIRHFRFHRPMKRPFARVVAVRCRRCAVGASPASSRRARSGRVRPKDASRSFRRRPSASTSRSRRSSRRSTRCRARSFRSSTSTAISRRRCPPREFDQRHQRRWTRKNLQILVNLSGIVRRSSAPGRRRDHARASTRIGWCCSRTSTSASRRPGLRREGRRSSSRPTSRPARSA